METEVVKAVIYPDLVVMPREALDTSILIWDPTRTHSVGYLRLDQGSYNSVYLSWYIDEKYRGKGYASHAIEQILPLLFEHYHRVVAITSPQNEFWLASRALALKHGFRFEGAAVDARWNLRYHRWETMEFWAMLKEEFRCS